MWGEHFLTSTGLGSCWSQLELQMTCMQCRALVDANRWPHLLQYHAKSDPTAASHHGNSTGYFALAYGLLQPKYCDSSSQASAPSRPFLRDRVAVQIGSATACCDHARHHHNLLDPYAKHQGICLAVGGDETGMCKWFSSIVADTVSITSGTAPVQR